MPKTGRVYSQTGWAVPTNHEHRLRMLKLSRHTRIQVELGLPVVETCLECLKLGGLTRRPAESHLQTKTVGMECLKLVGPTHRKV